MNRKDGGKAKNREIDKCKDTQLFAEAAVSNPFYNAVVDCSIKAFNQSRAASLHSDQSDATTPGLILFVTAALTQD